MDGLGDDALTAAALAERTEAQFLALPAMNGGGGEWNSAFLMAEAAWTSAEQTYAEAIPTTREGALRKLAKLRDLVAAMDLADDCLELRHIDSLAAYIQGK